MASTPSLPPFITRQRSRVRVPGGFDTDEELSPIKTEFGAHEIEHHGHIKDSVDYSSSPTPLPQDDNSLLPAPDDQDGDRTHKDMSMVNESEMRRKLMDVESSFLPELSPAGPPRAGGADDTYDFGAFKGGMDLQSHPNAHKVEGDEGRDQRETTEEDLHEDDMQLSPPTPPESYQTPAPSRIDDLPDGPTSQDDSDPDYHANTSSLETMSSSPTAAAAARTVSRVVSMATIGGYETADDRSSRRVSRKKGTADARDPEVTPRKTYDPSSPSSRTASPTPTKPQQDQEAEEAADGDVDEIGFDLKRQRKRPKFLRSRQQSQRSSYSSNTTTSTDPASDITVGADFALQSGGAAPDDNSINRPIMELSRSTSLGSMASGVSGLSDGDGQLDKARAVSSINDGGLAKLDEEETEYSETGTRRGRRDFSAPATPRATSRTLNVPTDTVIAQHVRNVQVPASVEQDYREKHQSSSPDKRVGMPTPSIGRSGKNMTLKEQSSTIERLGKENWDLKVKIWCLEKNLNDRSEEGVSDLISANVELRTDKLKLQREMRELRRTIRELERKLKEKEEVISKAQAGGPDQNSSPGTNGAGFQEIEEEVTYLRERVETYEVEIEKLRSEGTAREGEKRRLAGVVKSMGDRRSGESDIGVREELDMWKDLFETETARREEADEDNRKLREEIWRLKSDASSTTTNNHLSNVYHVTKRHHMSSAVSHENESDRVLERNGATSAASSSTLVEQLRHENAELRRDLAAQTSMLTSRNRERERLYQDVEELKLGQRRGDGVGSVAGDSIFERSASRAHGRSSSRASDGTRITQLSDAERDGYEAKNGELRDQISELKLKNQELTRKLKESLVELDQADAAKADYETLTRSYEDDIDQATQDLQAIQAERDEALRRCEETEADFEELKAEAQQNIDALEEELEQKGGELRASEVELQNRQEDFTALQNEMRSMSEGLIRIEDDAQKNLKKVQDLQLELEDTNRELESLENRLFETNSKAERLTVQQESSQSEIAFLREEQDGDKIKIGDLESAIKSAQTSLQDEKERVKELEERLAEERHQREVVGSKEKQEVQKVMNDLNREVSSAKDEARKLKKSLQSREQEATTWKERLMELENNLREALGDLNGTRSSLLTSITKLQKELDSTASELDITKNNLSEKERLLRNRDGLLESHGLESRKLSELLEKERQARRSDKYQHEQWQKTHQHTTRTVTQKETRIVELESARQSDRKKLSALEQRYMEQLGERNNLLLAIWNRLSTICGSDWQHKNSLINGNLPSLEVVSSMLPGFSKNLLLAVKTVEGLIGGFKSRIRSIERELWKEYQTLEHNLDVRVKRLDRLENSVQSGRSGSSQGVTPEIAKLKGENRLLKAELSAFRKQDSQSRSGRGDQRPPAGSNRDVSRTAMSATLMRHHSSSAVEALERASDTNPVPITSAPLEPSQQRWIHRLRELERRLKAEREARLLDRTGARKRLEEGRQEYEELKMELERERVRRGE